LVLKVCREFDDVTSVGKLFYVRAAATVNAQWTVVNRRDVQCRRRRWPQALSTGNPSDRWRRNDSAKQCNSDRTAALATIKTHRRRRQRVYQRGPWRRFGIAFRDGGTP